MNAVASAVVPVFGSVAMGYGLARCGLFGREVGSGLVRFMYYLAIPAMLFGSLSTAALPERMPWAYLFAFYVPSFALFICGLLLARGALAWARHEAGMAAMVAAYSNMVLLGFPLTLSAFGSAGAVPMFILLAMQSTLLFPLTTWALEAGADGAAGGARFYVRTVMRLLVNPVILSLMLGVMANLTGFTAPEAAQRLLQLLGSAGPGCALVALGISLAEYRLRGAYRDVIVLVVLKTLAHPLLVWLACLVLDIEQGWMQVAVLLAAMPCGINAFIFASQYGVREETVSKCIVLSTLVSSVVTTLLLAHFITG